MTASPPEQQLEERLRDGSRVLVAVARRISRRLGGLVDRDDLESLGRPALLIAARTFDSTRGRFGPYVASRVKWAIIDGVRRETHGRAAVARCRALAAADRASDSHAETGGSADEHLTQEASEASLDQFLETQAAALVLSVVVSGPDMDLTAGPEATPEEAALGRESRTELETAMQSLPADVHTVIRNHYFEDETLEVIATRLGVSKSWASRLHTQGLAALGKVLRRK
jgi:RNA polymerase sigma factor for flagellar operon FliA